MYNDTLTINNVNGVYEIYNYTKKIMPNGSIKYKKYSYDTIKGFNRKVNLHNGTSTEEQLKKYEKKRLKERKDKIVDIALCNNWKYFITLTFNPNDKKIFPNGYNHIVAISLLKKWINNQKKKNKNMKYILVSEFHKVSGNLHFHGLFNNVKWDLIPSINPHNNSFIYENGVQIYNLNDYTLGFTSVSEIQDSRKVSFYLSKYITKDLISLKFKKVFWHSRNITLPIIEYGYSNISLSKMLEDHVVDFYKKYETTNSSIEVAEKTDKRVSFMFDY